MTLGMLGVRGLPDSEDIAVGRAGHHFGTAGAGASTWKSPLETANGCLSEKRRATEWTDGEGVPGTTLGNHHAPSGETSSQDIDPLNGYHAAFGNRMEWARPTGVPEPPGLDNLREEREGSLFAASVPRRHPPWRTCSKGWPPTLRLLQELILHGGSA